MTIMESFKIALSSIWNHKVRAILTMLGIIIGVAAVIVIVAIGDGAKAQLTEDLFSTDKNAIELYFEQFPNEEDPNMFDYVEPPTIKSEDLEALKELPSVKRVVGTNQGFGSIMHNEKHGEIQLIGVGTDYFQNDSFKLIEGRYFNYNDVAGFARVVMVDTEAKKKYFKESENIIGEIIDIDDNPYKVIGVYESATPEMYRMEAEGLMPRTLISMMFGNEEIETVTIFAEEASELTMTGTMAGDKLTELTGTEDGMYTFYDMSDEEDEMNNFFGTITLVIGSIAGISLLVGGIGVMNIMLVSVTERTREIGLRKALGATRGKILLQFLIEAMTLTSLGGLIGIGFAATITTIASNYMPFEAIINPIIVIIGVAFSAFIGILFGIIPANKASKLSPIDALRYE